MYALMSGVLKKIIDWKIENGIWCLWMSVKIKVTPQAHTLDLLWTSTSTCLVNGSTYIYWNGWTSEKLHSKTIQTKGILFKKCLEEFHLLFGYNLLVKSIFFYIQVQVFRDLKKPQSYIFDWAWRSSVLYFTINSHRWKIIFLFTSESFALSDFILYEIII